MSWFKRGGERRSPESDGQPQSDTDPNTCFEVFQNHWKQAWAVISCQDKKATTLTGQATSDGVEAVLRNLEQMVTLLVSEDDDGGLPGPILQHVLESDLLEKVCSWCTINVSAHDKLRMQQLRLFELIISQSKQMLLIHKPVIKPLLRLLIDVADSHEISNGELEFKLVLVLHQICLCISQQNLILESFFSTDADHGPARFLIFSLLIPYIHREGSVGQKARDALLLIMTLSARHPHIGQYIANNSDFCPVLATGLSGLYSSLPRRITPPTDDWHAITWEDCVKIPDLQMFLNSLQFSNAVVQVAHPRVRAQLIEFIYSGFLVPVLAPALHQISREEVMTATAYLDLFIRHVTEPHLLKAVLRFVLLEKYDDIPVLESLLSRISSNSHLATVTLSLFHTLIDLNCEDVMFQLVFRYLVPCTHVMVSQRRSVRDLDLYSKSAEKFLSLRPKCCSPATASGPPPAPANFVGTSPQTQRLSVSSISTIAGPTLPVMSSPFAVSPDQQPLETSYFEYLLDARNRLEQTLQACYHWSLPYDGENPPPDSIASADKIAVVGEVNKSGRSQQAAPPATGYIELGSILNMAGVEERGDRAGSRSSAHQVTFDIKPSASRTSNSVLLPQEIANSHLVSHKHDIDHKLFCSLDNVDAFINYLAELDINVDVESHQHGQSTDEWMTELADLLKAKSAKGFHRTSSNKDGSEDMRNKSSNSAAVSSLSSVITNAAQISFSPSDIDISLLDSSQGSRTSLKGFTLSEISKTKVAMQKEQLPTDLSSSEDASTVPNGQDGDKDASSVLSDGELDLTEVPSALGTSTSTSLTTNKERSVPKDLPSSLRASPHPAYSLPTSVFSPTKTVGEMLPPFRSALTPADEFPVTAMSSPGLTKLKYLNDPPNIGPFLSAVFARLEGMISNSLYFNLLLTGILSRLAAYPQPLLRSFLLNHNLVFQPSVKSLIQVLSSLRQKLDNFSTTVKLFDSLVVSARQNLAQRDGQLFQSSELGMLGPVSSVLPQIQQKTRADSISGILSIKEKKKVTLSDLIFRRSPGREKLPGGKSSRKQTQPVWDSEGSPAINNHSSTSTQPDGSTSTQPDGSMHTLTTWNAVYSALVLDEFLKELAALSQEHSVLHSDEGYLSS